MGTWTPSTINGDRRTGDGILHQGLYIGMRVFNRRKFRKHPDTGRRSSTLNPPEAWMREPAPGLRIVDDALWAKVQVRKGELSAPPAAHARSPKRLLPGLLKCGLAQVARRLERAQQMGLDGALEIADLKALSAPLKERRQTLEARLAQAAQAVRPLTSPQPVTTPSPGTRCSAMPNSVARCSTNMSNSSKPPSSSRRSMRSRR